MKYAIHTLDMWGHVPADCPGHGCPCMRPDLANTDPDNATDAPRVHDDDACQCSEDCNQQFRRGTLTVTEGTDDAALLTLLGEEGFTFPPGSVVDDYGDCLDVNDADGRRLLHLTTLDESEVSS